MIRQIISGGSSASWKGIVVKQFEKAFQGEQFRSGSRVLAVLLLHFGFHETCTIVAVLAVCLVHRCALLDVATHLSP